MKQITEKELLKLEDSKKCRILIDILNKKTKFIGGKYDKTK